MERIIHKLKQENSIIFILQQEEIAREDSVEMEMVEEKKNVKKGPHQQKEKNMTNKHIDSDKQSGEDKKSIQVTRPISPTVLLVLQKKIKCKQCCACMRVKSKMRRGRPWMLVCENNACTSPKTELCSTEALAGAVHCEEDAKKSERRENILKNCFEENY